MKSDTTSQQGYQVIPHRRNRELGKTQKFISLITSEGKTNLPKHDRSYLIQLAGKLNEDLQNLFKDYQRLYKRFVENENLVLTKETLNDFVEELLTPTNGELGCTEFEYKVRRRYFKEDNTLCPYLRCRYWFDNHDWGNCTKFVIAKSGDDEGWTLEKIGEVPNLISKGNLSRERIRQLENDAIQHFTQRIKDNPETTNLATEFIRIRKKGALNGLCNKSGTGNVTE